MSTGAEATRTLLLDAAEQLVALRGLVGASDRAIMQLAGQRNKSVIAYHFGSRQHLLDMVWERGTVTVDAERRRRLDALVAEGRDTDLHELVRLYVEPQLAVLRLGAPSYWARFTARVLEERPLVFMSWVRDDLARYDHEVPLHTLLDLFARMQRLLPLEPAVAERRVALAARSFAALFAAWERDLEQGLASADDRDAFAAELVGLVMAVLSGI